MLARCATYVLDGIDARRVTVECDVRAGLPSFTIVGLSDTATRELRDTVRAAILNCGHQFPDSRVTVNVAPAWLRHASHPIALAVAVAVLRAAGEVSAEQRADVAVYGALKLDGTVAPHPGALAAAVAHRSSGAGGPLLHAGPPLPADLGPVASQRIWDLADIPSYLRHRTLAAVPVGPTGPRPDFADVRGRDAAIFALTVAAAGGHHVLLRGAPGAGATMLARRLVTILPELTEAEQLEVATIRDAVGLGRERERPFRAPHHTISVAGLVGGGSPPRPGEITLAHRGVLFLDELTEFRRATLEALRQPLADRSVAIVRGSRAYQFPAGFQLVAATAPCPCGSAGTDSCSCGSGSLARDLRRLSGSLLDRFAIVVDLPANVDVAAAAPGPSSAELRDQVLAARDRQAFRDPAAIDCRSSAPPSALGAASPASEAALERAAASGSLSPRGRLQVLQVARTVADLAGEDAIGADALHAALALRGLGAAPPDPRPGSVSPLGAARPTAPHRPSAGRRATPSPQ